MMILRNYNWEHEIRFDDGTVTHLVIENPKTLRDYSSELMSQTLGEEGSFVLSHDNEVLSIAGNVAVAINPIFLEFDEKRINTKIIKDLVSFVKQDPEKQKEFYPLSSFIEKYANKIVDDYYVSLKFDIPDEASVLKMLNFKICLDDGSYAERLLEWVNMNREMLGYSVFVILNANDFFTYDEMLVLDNELKSLKCDVLFIDASNKYCFENTIIIDNDNCELF